MPNSNAVYPWRLNLSAKAPTCRLIEDIAVMPFDAAAGAVYGEIRLATRDSKKDQFGKSIAAHAAALGVTVVTNKVRDFARYPGMVTGSWHLPSGHLQARGNAPFLFGAIDQVVILSPQ